MALFSAYRIDQYADPDGFKNSLGAVLEGFDNEVIQYVCDPRTGIQRRYDWPPSLAQVVTACEDHREHLKKTRERKPVYPRLAAADLPRPQGDLANLFVPEGHPRYAAFVEWTNSHDPKWWKNGNSSDGRRGLWIPQRAWDGMDVDKLEVGRK